MPTEAAVRRRRSTLHRRMVVGLVGLSLLIASLAGLGVWASDVWIEDAAVRDLMERELSYLIGPHAPAAPNRAYDALRFYAGERVPARLRDYKPGYYEDLRENDRSFNLLVRETEDGGNAYLLYDISFIEEREDALLWTGLIALLGVGVLSYFISLYLARRALAPLDRLVGQLGRLDPERRGERLVLDIDDSELSVIVDAINRYMGELDALVERERAFAAAASHELRTPIAVIQGAAETLALQGEKPALKRIERAVAMARHEIDALLALSRVRDTPRLESLDLQHVLHELADPYVAQMPGVRVTWDIPAPVRLAAAPGAIAAIFTNLLRNAVRAAPKGAVTVRVRADHFAIEDDGPGIAAAALPRIFEPGFSSRDGGTGMGLYIARTLAMRFGWRLTVENRDGGGVRGALYFAPQR
ncbi:sensor histidine kinase [Solimonas soli]|uniref:sensor histidine kinase n=1 Tax=Solimonas soli TaxID=413479 RepID=UPI000487F588|nr:HAMP domain-containing sensor histidine kinase [Solimonas soli]